MKLPKAKAKKRREQIEADEEAIKEFEKNITIVKAGRDEKPRHEVPTGEVVNIMADEIQVIYELTGSRLDEVNARDKALILWRDLGLKGFHARETEVSHVLCEEHE